MDQDYHDAVQEIGDVPATVCLEHGNFVPCRKRGEHRTSSDPQDIDRVRYHQEVSVRLQNPPPRRQEDFREVDVPAEDWPYFVDEHYGSVQMRCGGRVFNRASSERFNHKYLIGCAESFDASTPAELIVEIRRHLLVTPHFEEVPEGRYEVVPEG